MTIGTTTRKNYYVADGVTTVFPYTFKVVESGQLKVYFEDADGLLTIQGSGFSVTGVGDPAGGDVTFVLPPGGTTAKVLLIRQTDITQNLDIVAGGKIGSDPLEKALDKIVCAVQEIMEDSDRAVTTRTQDGEVGITIPNSSEGAALYWEGGILLNTPFNILSLAAGLGITLPAAVEGQALRWAGGVLSNYTPVSATDLENIDVSGADLYLADNYNCLMY